MPGLVCRWWSLVCFAVHAPLLRSARLPSSLMLSRPRTIQSAVSAGQQRPGGAAIYSPHRGRGQEERRGSSQGTRHQRSAARPLRRPAAQTQGSLRVELPRAHLHLRAAHHDRLRRLPPRDALPGLARRQLVRRDAAARQDPRRERVHAALPRGQGLNLHVSQVTDQVLLIITFGRETQVGKVRLYTQRAIEVLRPIFEDPTTTTRWPWTPTSRPRPARPSTTSSRTCETALCP